MWKQLITKILSFMIVLLMMFNFSISSFASDNYGDIKSHINAQEDIDTVREIYAALTPEAKAVFDASLIYDPEMLEFHTTYVEQNLALFLHRTQLRTIAAVEDPMRILTRELSLLRLPSAVLYTLKAMGASMTVAIADGPLPVGEIMLAATTVSAVLVIVSNWKEVAPKFDQIVRAFQKAFSTAASNVSIAFAKIKNAVKKEIDKKEKEKKEIEDTKKKIPSRLKDSNGNVKIGEFKERVKNSQPTAYKEKRGWIIEKDRDGHKGSKWKLKNEKGTRIASLKENGEVVGK